MQKPQSSLQKSRTIGNYIITKNLGQGTFGKVKLGIHSITNEKVAIKILEKNKIVDVADVERVTRQIHILKQIRHPNLIQLYEIIQTPRQLFLVMQYVSEGQLFEHIVKKKRLKENQACQFFRQLIEGVEYMHNLNIVHRDLKPQNLLIDFNKRLKIVDFGLSNTYKNKQLLKTACGSPCYAAPEMIAGKKYHGLTADIWSSGVILFAMICGYLPFQDPNTSNLYKKIISGDFTIPKFVSPFARQLLQKILTTDPDRRYKISDIKKHSWYRQPIQLEFKSAFGIKVGFHNIPVDQSVLADVIAASPEQSYEETKKFISNNRHNHPITIYYLLLKKNLRNGIQSSFDICSPSFQVRNLEKNLPEADAQHQQNIKKITDELEQIQLDRVTTATGQRTFRAFNRANRSLISNDSPDITAHNFYVNKSKNKPSKLLDSSIAKSIDTDSSQFGNLVELTQYQPNTQRRRIYYQTQNKNTLGIVQKVEKSTINPERQRNDLQISLYDIDKKKQAFSQYYRQDKKGSAYQTGRQPISFRARQKNRILLSKQFDRKSLIEETGHSKQIPVRQQNQFNNQRYASLNISTRGDSRSNKTPRESYKQLMNKTFMGKISKTYGLSAENQSDRMKSILNSTITGGFNSGRRKINSNAKDISNRIRFNF